MIKMFHGAGLANSYYSLFRLEASLARTVLSAERRDGLFIPRRLKKGLLVHFAVDNIKFREDTVDGKGTFHGTVTVAFKHHSWKLHVICAWGGKPWKLLDRTEQSSLQNKRKRTLR